MKTRTIKIMLAATGALFVLPIMSAQADIASTTYVTTAIAPKADKAATTDSGQIASVTANGNYAGSGVTTADLTGAITAANNATTDITKLKTDVATNTTNITTLQGDVATNTTNIAGNTTAITNLQNNTYTKTQADANFAVKATEGVAAGAATAAAAAQTTADTAQTLANTINTTLTTNDTVAKANSALQSADISNMATTTALNTAISNEVTRSDAAYAVKATEGVAAGAATAAAAAQATADATNTTLTTNNTVAKANAALPTPPTACSDPVNYCVLTTDGTIYKWEVIAR